MFDSTVERRIVAANESAIEVAAWLTRWCPDQARAFALSMHERASWHYDDDRTEHWHRVLRLLTADQNSDRSGLLTTASCGRLRGSAVVPNL